ncbi:hypothetical protein DFQ26_008023 [Actinomortierella ambigua]|nr:hypothetical protein DFQ26_008023 [Actinomortierella ambigua]
MSINRNNVYLVVGMLVAGTANTIITKYQDRVCVANCDDPDPSKHEHFEQPLWQTLNMFLGESLCLILAGICALLAAFFGRAKWAELVLDEEDPQPHSATESDGLIAPVTTAHSTSAAIKPRLQGPLVFLLWVPTLCDMTATTLMNVGLVYTTASVYQMLRGALVIITGLLSVIFLKRKLLAYEWFALITITVGIATVGLASVLHTSKSVRADPTDEDAAQAFKAMFGIFLVLFAQLFTAAQFVIEEKFLSGYQIAPLRAVGYEGIFGTISVLIAMPIFHYTIGIHDPKSSFNLHNGWDQISSHSTIWIPAIIIMFSISSFNFFGISVTKTICATSRSTIDSCRTLFIWMISLYLGWETFLPLQVVGFIMLVYGTFVFNGVVEPPFCRPPKAINEGENEPLLGNNA